MLGDRKRRDGYGKVQDRGSEGVEDGERVQSDEPELVNGEDVHAGRVFWVSPIFGHDGVQVSSGIGVDGKEYPDPVPQAVELGIEPSVDVLKRIDQLVESRELRAAAAREGFDSPEEAMDLDMPDEEPWPESAYEENFWPDEQLASAARTPIKQSGLTGGEDNKPSAKAPSPPSLSPDKLKDDGGPGAKPPSADAS